MVKLLAGATLVLALLFPTSSSATCTQAQQLQETWSYIKTSSASVTPAARTWLPLRQESDPLLLTKISFNTSGAITGGEVRNTSNSPISAYHFGLLLLKRGQGEPTFVPGPVVQITGPINPGETRGVPGPLALEEAVTGRNVFAVAIFVSKIRFQDGSTWNANIDEMMKRFEENSTSATYKN